MAEPQIKSDEPFLGPIEEPEDEDARQAYYLVASEHVYNMANMGLNIHSDMLCDIVKRRNNP